MYVYLIYKPTNKGVWILYRTNSDKTPKVFLESATKKISSNIDYILSICGDEENWFVDIDNSSGAYIEENLTDENIRNLIV
jgi:hypothetical protein